LGPQAWKRKVRLESECAWISKDSDDTAQKVVWQGCLQFIMVFR